MASPIETLPETNLQVLEQLHIYRFLTAPQFLRLEVASHIDSMYRTLRRLQTSPRQYVDFAEFGVLPNVGRLPRVHYLTKYGAACLAEALRVAPETIAYPKGARLFSRDYFHRTATIDFEIELRRFAGRQEAAVEFFHRYFDTDGANRGAAAAAPLTRRSRLPLGKGYFVPDAVFAVRAPDGTRYLYVLEVYNGSDTKRVHTQLKKHRLALEEGRVSELFGQQPAAHRVVCVFETAAALQAAVRRIAADADFTEAMRRQFAFSTLPALQANFVTGWEFLVPGRTCIFDLDP